MEKILFNNGWKYAHLGVGDFKEIDLPHDAMIYENRAMENKSGTNESYFAGGEYEYHKDFVLPENFKDKEVVVEFGGVYHNAEVYLNGQKLCFKPYGYTDFYVDLTPAIKKDELNHLVVVAKNADQPNSRWYTGSGIYRDVYLYALPEKHILLNGIKIKTVDYQTGRISVFVKTSCSGQLTATVLDEGQEVISTAITTEGETSFELTIPRVKLWGPEQPKLYELKVDFDGDIHVERFGVRQLEWSKENGIALNGEHMILRGACIHHDNGLLGARATRLAEYRKIKILKEAGYNAIRSAHNPCSKNLLDACDEYGVLVMDEYADCWYIHKTKYDYATYLKDYWQEDLKELVDKDYNHPSVIAYSSGNEVAETSEKKGIELTKQFTEYFHQLDDTRPVSCGINIFFNFLYSMGFGVYSDKKAESSANAKVKKKKQSVGSEFFNNLAGLLGAGFMKFGATLHGSDVKTRDAFAAVDVAGYNYGINRYKHDLKKYPNRLILGSETFCADAYQFYSLAKKNNRILGDFVWAGMDYLGEVGIGSWTPDEYCDGDFAHQLGWLAAGSGRVDITGKTTSETDYTRVAFELDKINIGVVPPNHYNRKYSPSSWRFSRAERSWNYPGEEGKNTEVEVYAICDHVELYLNDKKVGKKKMEKDACTVFKTKYQPGVLKAISYDKENHILAEMSLFSGGSQPELRLEPEEKELGLNDLIYVRMRYTDENGLLISNARADIQIESLENCVLLGFGNGGAYNPRGYITNVSDTYYGEALAVFKPLSVGVAKIKCSSKFGSKEIEISIK